jgi:Domain of unknown function (DUF1707)/Domain of unknown function (DUF4190)
VTIDPAANPMFSRPGGNGASAWPPGMLAANADRERAIDVLRAGYAEGRLTKAEYESRVTRVYAARTYGELGALTADLPNGSFGYPAPYQSVGYPPPQPAYPTVSSAAVAALACGIGEFFTLGLTAIPAIVLGHVARRQVRQTGQRGDGMALAGLILGYAGIGLLAFMITLMLVSAAASGHAAHAVVVHAIPAPPPPPALPLQGG